MKIVQASFFWKNDQKDGLGFTLGPPDWSPGELTTMFTGDVVKQYMRDSDAQLGTAVIADYLAQLSALAAEAKRAPLPLPKALLAAMNIMWLAERGFIPNDEFNGPIFVVSK